jgi:hypothetical protein
MQQLVGLSGLPAGDYVVWATISNEGSGNETILCSLDGPAGTIQPHGEPFRVEFPETVTVTGVVKNAPANTVLSVDCGQWPDLLDSNPPTAWANIEALPLTTLQ